MEDEYELRSDEFGKAYEDFEGDDIVRLVVRTGEFLETVLMEKAPVAAAMTSLHDAIFGQPLDRQEGLDWRQTWENVSCTDHTEMRTVQFLVGLNAYAFYGLRPSIGMLDAGEAAEDLGKAVEACVLRGRALLDAVPPGWDKGPEMTRTILAAEGRLRLDQGHGVSPEQLAALGRLSVKSVRNMLTPQAGGADMSLDAGGHIPADQALRWLTRRPDFRSSIWMSDDADSTRTRLDEPNDLGEVVFVPVAKDGSWFDPVSCRNGRGYTVGPKGNEEKFDDYAAALKRLTQMPTPQWRRPNAIGNWGIVAGKIWDRRSVAILGAKG